MRRENALFGLAALAALMAPGAALAETSFGAQAGTSGFGVEARYDLTEHLAMRGTISTLNWDLDQTYDSVAYSGKLDFSPAGIYLDYHPFANGFFVTGGALLGGPKLDLTATPAAPVTLGGVSYTPAE